MQWLVKVLIALQTQLFQCNAFTPFANTFDLQFLGSSYFLKWG